jgi:hypothetical protein
LVCYDQETASEHIITDEHIADAFAHNERFRRYLDLQGINPDTLGAFTDEGRTMISAIITGWVRALRIPPDTVGEPISTPQGCCSLRQFLQAFLPSKKACVRQNFNTSGFANSIPPDESAR